MGRLFRKVFTFGGFICAEAESEAMVAPTLEDLAENQRKNLNITEKDMANLNRHGVY